MDFPKNIGQQPSKHTSLLVLTSFLSSYTTGKLLKESIPCALITIALSCINQFYSHYSIPFPIKSFFSYNPITCLSHSLSTPQKINWTASRQWLEQLNHRPLPEMSQKYGPVFLLKLSLKNLDMVTNPELANQVLHAQGRSRHGVHNLGEQWRKLWRIMTLPFLTNEVVHQHSDMWGDEMDLVVHGLRNDERVSREGIVIKNRLQLMLYSIMYRMMFATKFDSQNDSMFIEATQFNSERSRLAQSFQYNYGDFIPLHRPFLRGYLNRCRHLQRKRLEFFNYYHVEKRRSIMLSKFTFLSKKIEISILDTKISH